MLQLLLTIPYQLELLCLTNPDAAPVAYMDNTFLLGHAEAVTAAFPMLWALDTAIGLEFASRTVLGHSANTGTVAGRAEALDILH